MVDFQHIYAALRGCVMVRNICIGGVAHHEICTILLHLCNGHAGKFWTITRRCAMRN